MKLLFRLVIVSALCLTAITLLAVPAQADEPSISLFPSSGVPGDSVTVYGEGFQPDEEVTIYYDGEQQAKDMTNEHGRFAVPITVPESHRGAHIVLAVVGDDEADSDFFVTPGLTVRPTEGPVGTTVTVEGQGFARNETGIKVRYYLNGTYEVVAGNITADAAGWWEESFQIPPSPTGNRRIDAEGDSSSLASVRSTTFGVTPRIGIDEDSGSVGQSIEMTGAGFAANEKDIRILFGGEAVVTDIEADDRGHWTEPFEVPELLQGIYTVTAEGAQTRKEDLNELSFQIKPGIILSPDKGHVGMNVTVTGGGFAAGRDVVIRYEDSQVATDTTDAKGSFEVMFPVPESKHGKRQVTAADARGNEAAADFTMESNPPDTPGPISPTDGGRVGFVGGVKPRFEWSEVFDDSGVYYNLQIAASANVTMAGEFVDPIVTKEGLVGSNYTLESSEALPFGTYYWIVQAVDGAENESGWTDVYSFRAGLLPLWAFIVIMVGIAALIGGLVYFFVIRRRAYY